MFICTKRAGYTRDGEQFASGRFLILMQPDGGMEALREPIRAIVRHVHMRQLGHFMMARWRIAGRVISLSGAYGNDGLTLSVPREIYELGEILPDELREAWNKGGGWNSAGSEATAMREWARATFKRRSEAK